MRKKREDNSNIFHKKEFDKNLNAAISKNILLKMGEICKKL